MVGQVNTLSSATAVGGRLEAIRAGLIAMMLGIVAIGIVGFAHPQAIHDAAHDTRHANITPCH